jgi:hypothetical protein
MIAHALPAVTAGEQRADELIRLLSDRIMSGDFDATLAAFDPADIAARMTAVLGDTRHPAADRVGPVYTTAALARWKGVSRQAIQNAQRQHRILAFKTADGAWLYPAYQFGPRGEYLPDLPRVLALLDPTDADPTTPILWLNQPHDDWDGDTGAQRLRAGRVDDVLPAAAQMRRAWAS